MAKDRSAVAEKQHASELTTQRNAFRVGEQIAYDGKLAKVVNFGYLELPSAPGKDIEYSDALVAHLQLPALVPGGPPEYARFVPVDEMTSLRDDPKKLRALQKEFLPLMGEKAPADDAALYTEPDMKRKGRAGVTDVGKRSGAEGVSRIKSRAERAPVDLSRTPAAEGKKVSTADTATEAKPKGAKRSASSKKSSKKSAK